MWPISLASLKNCVFFFVCSIELGIIVVLILTREIHSKFKIEFATLQVVFFKKLEKNLIAKR